MTSQSVYTFRITPLALAGLLLAGPAHAADTPAQLRAKDLQQRLARSDAQAAALQQRIEQLERRLEAMRTAISNAPTAAATVRPAAIAQAAGTTPPRPPAQSSGSSAAARSAPGSFEVDEEAAQRALERTLTQSGALLLPPRTVELTPSFTYRRLESTTSVPANFTPPGGGAPVLVLANQRLRRSESTARLDIRAGMPYNTQLELGIPYSHVRQSQVTDFSATASSRGDGIGDATLGIARTLTRESGWKPDVIGRLSYNFGNGKRQDGAVALTGGYRQLQAELVTIKRQDPLAFVASAFYARAFERDAVRPGDAAGISLSAILAASPATSLQFGFSQIHRQEQRLGGAKITGSDQTYGIVNLGASSVLSRDTTLVTQFGIGVGNDAPKYSFSLSLPILFR